MAPQSKPPLAVYTTNERRAFALVRRDIARYLALEIRPDRSGLFTKLRVFLDAPGLQCILVYRFGSWVNRTFRYAIVRYPLKFIYYVLQKLCVICWGIHIDEHARIGGGLYIGHFGGVVIGPVDIGRDCNLAHQVTIGRRADGVPGYPAIGDRVWIGVGSVVFGNVRIGDGVTIGPCTVVSRGLPSNALVIGNPMRVLRTNYDNSVEIYGVARK